MSTVQNATHNSVLIQSVGKVIPNSLRWPEIKSTIPTKRTETKIKALQQNYSARGNKIIRFYIPNVSFLDFRRGYISFILQTTRTNGTYIRPSNGSWTIFERIRLKTSVDIEDIRNYNTISTVLYEISTHPEVTATVGKNLYGMGTQAERNLFETTPVRVIMPIPSQFLLSGVIPMQFITERVELELYIDDPINCLETDSTTNDILITDPWLVGEKIDPDPSYTNSVVSSLASTGLNLNFTMWENYINSFSTQKASLNINHRSDSIESIISVMRSDVSVSNPTINDRFYNWSKYNLQQYQLKINGEFEPEEPIDTTGNATQNYIIFLKWLGKWSGRGIYYNPPNIDNVTYNNSRFLLINDLQAHPDSGYLNPRSTSHASATMQIDLLLGSVPPTNIRVDSFVQFHTIVTINRLGKLIRHY